jgi:hypothetical protein
MMWQFMSEKIGGAKGTELDEDFTEMERVRINTISFRVNSSSYASSSLLKWIILV